MEGKIHMEGYKTVNRTLCRCIADISLEENTVVARLVPLEDTAGFPLVDGTR